MLDTPRHLDFDRCLAAVRARDPAADGTFLVGVVTTGIYCRPSCPSRPALAENLRFFETADDAEAFGLRPCKRCRPREASPVEHHRRAVAAACAAIEAAEAAPALAALAAEAGMSRHHFHRVFTQIVGATPGAYARTVKLRRLAGALAEGAPVAEAVYAAGYGSASRAYAAAETGLGMTPGARRKGGAGTRIGYALRETPLGLLLLAASERGVCATAFGEEAGALLDDLRARFPAADLARDEARLGPWADALAAHVETPARALDLPLDIQGTAFQARVWQALRDIPPGETVSYAQVAAALGRPAAVRAVARACASNEIAVLIPCHRVVRADGSLSGYRWGPERKAALLAAESRAGTAEPAEVQP